MAGPPASVKLAAPIPTSHFSPVPNLGPALQRLTDFPGVYQHTGYPTILPASWQPWELIGGPNPPILPLRWNLPTPPIGWWQQLVDRFRPQRTY